eukprot:GEMP01034855.1.p1 GENE.GEMP01034855.1~~GEMP01034855.1.p1  ORF type:complete len:518 (-),score=41.88 GEMP01034855.1:182-1735(-)
MYTLAMRSAKARSQFFILVLKNPSNHYWSYKYTDGVAPTNDAFARCFNDGGISHELVHMVNDAIKKVLDEHRSIEPTRVTMVGYSMGGNGVLTYLWQSGNHVKNAIIAAGHFGGTSNEEFMCCTDNASKTEHSHFRRTFDVIQSIQERAIITKCIQGRKSVTFAHGIQDHTCPVDDVRTSVEHATKSWNEVHPIYTKSFGRHPNHRGFALIDKWESTSMPITSHGDVFNYLFNSPEIPNPLGVMCMAGPKFYGKLMDDNATYTRPLIAIDDLPPHVLHNTRSFEGGIGEACAMCPTNPFIRDENMHGSGTANQHLWKNAHTTNMRNMLTSTDADSVNNLLSRISDRKRQFDNSSHNHTYDRYNNTRKRQRCSESDGPPCIVVDQSVMITRAVLSSEYMISTGNRQYCVLCRIHVNANIAAHGADTTNADKWSDRHRRHMTRYLLKTSATYRKHITEIKERFVAHGIPTPTACKKRCTNKQHHTTTKYNGEHTTDKADDAKIQRTRVRPYTTTSRTRI